MQALTVVDSDCAPRPQNEQAAAEKDQLKAEIERLKVLSARAARGTQQDGIESSCPRPSMSCSGYAAGKRGLSPAVPGQNSIQ